MSSDATSAATTSQGVGKAESQKSRSNTDESEEQQQQRQSSEGRLNGLLSPSGTIKSLKNRQRPQLQARASTAVSRTDIYTQPQHEAPPPVRPPRSRAASTAHTTSFRDHLSNRRGSDADDNASIKSFRSSLSFAPQHGDNVESLLGDLAPSADARSRDDDDDLEGHGDLFAALAIEDAGFRELFHHEFDELEELHQDGSNEGTMDLF